ncbi:hypothetical protein BMS3Abin10_02380 [bacterium BMS3Abin10]|nr:hypothetical protein BMS3Abin10_02380 [bacterium BMS3Abin10]
MSTRQLNLVSILSLLLVLFLTASGFANGSADYLILQDIGPYKISTPEKLFPGEPPIGGPRTYDSHGIIGATGHFPDHIDRTYEVMYLGETDALPSPTVQVTQHAGSESDKWLLHEVERGFRFGDYEEDMTPSRFRNIDGSYVFYSKLGGGGIDG